MQKCNRERNVFSWSAGGGIASWVWECALFDFRHCAPIVCESLPCARSFDSLKGEREWNVQFADRLNHLASERSLVFMCTFWFICCGRNETTTQKTENEMKYKKIVYLLRHIAVCSRSWMFIGKRAREILQFLNKKSAWREKTCKKTISSLFPDGPGRFTYS